MPRSLETPDTLPYMVKKGFANEMKITDLKIDCPRLPGEPRVITLAVQSGKRRGCRNVGQV